MLLWPVVAVGFLAVLFLARHPGGAVPDRLVATTSGTAVCGTLPSGQTVWNATGSPYAICGDGITVPSGSTLVLDGSAGAVSVRAQGPGGITVAGTLETTGTSSSSQVSFGGANAAPGGWSGLSVTAGGRLDLDHVGVNGATTGITATDPGGFGVSNSTVSDSSADGIALTVTRAPSAAPSLTGDIVTRAGRYGVVVHGPTGGTTPLQLRSTRVDTSGVATDASRAPAVLLDGVTGTYGTGGDINGVTGGGNGIDGLAWSGELTPAVAEPLTWPTITSASSEHRPRAAAAGTADQQRRRRAVRRHREGLAQRPRLRSGHPRRSDRRRRRWCRARLLAGQQDRRGCGDVSEHVRRSPLVVREVRTLPSPHRPAGP